MQARKRYTVVLLSGVLLLLLYYGGLHMLYNEDRQNTLRHIVAKLRPYDWLTLDAKNYDFDSHISTRTRREAKTQLYKGRKCRMETCFDISKCRNGFKLYVYPDDDLLTPTYIKVLAALRNSRYITDDPSEACLFIPAIDMIDRDKLSSDMVHDAQDRIERLPYWNNGRNHMIFNLYSGTWPEYSEELSCDLGQAMIAKASMTKQYFRNGFDISWPLFPKNHPEKGGFRGELQTNNFPIQKHYLLVFKGKRYLFGVGSDTRNALYHLHNGQDIILLTTCKHGKDWQAHKDSRCDHDNAEYDKYDYQVLLHNSTFCLTPRGRRLGSFRFLEALQAGCIPVVLSNGWELPFTDIIDWDSALIKGDERLLLQIPSIVRSIDDEQIMRLKQQTQILWDSYFSSLDKIVDTTIEIIRSRVEKQLARERYVWNSAPGAMAVLPGYADHLAAFPFYQLPTGSKPSAKFTAIILAKSPILSSSAPIMKLLKNVGHSVNVAQIVVLWNVDRPLPPKSKWPAIDAPLTVVEGDSKSVGSRFKPLSIIETDAILSLDDDTVMDVQEVDFAFSVWQSYTDRIVGFPARTHYWDESKSTWGYSSKWTNEYSMVLTGAAFYHRYYHYLYSNIVPLVAREYVDNNNNCEDILFNFLVAHVTHLPPVKLSQKKLYKDVALGLTSVNTPAGQWTSPLNFNTRQLCMNTFVSAFGYMPLMRSQVRLDPMLYKDPVSVLRKRYPKMEVGAPKPKT